MRNNEYWTLRRHAQDLFLEWYLCQDKKKAKTIYDEYLGILRKASEIAPSVDEVWTGDS